MSAELVSRATWEIQPEFTDFFAECRMNVCDDSSSFYRKNWIIGSRENEEDPVFISHSSRVVDDVDREK